MAKFKNKVSVVCAESYFKSLKKLPANIQAEANVFFKKFIDDPTSPGLNYETIKVVDSTLRSARVNGSYRAIIRIPEEKDTYTLLWIDAHDAAYNWASKKRISVNPVSNIVQIYDVVTSEENQHASIYNNYDTKLFDYISNDDLLKLNVPEDVMFVVRAIINEKDFQTKKRFLPDDVYEYLSFLNSGLSLNEVLEEAAENAINCGTQKLSVDEAIVKSGNSNKFYLLDGDESTGELERILDAPIEEWRIFLHPSQKKIVEQSFNGPARILGGAGTGKTVVAMHRAKWLMEHVFNMNEDKILFTTFSTNLANDIRENLKILCSSSVFNKIEVINLDKWIAKLLQKTGNKSKLIFGKELERIWGKAILNSRVELDFSIGFYMEEYEKVILVNELETFEDYKKTNRIGRGTSLNREEKIQVWDVIMAYKILLSNFKIIDSGLAAIKIRKIIEESEKEFLYKSIIVDEAQDFSDCAFKLLRAIAGKERNNDIFIVGDAHQRIYGKKVILKRCGINITGRSGLLKINYRTTEEIDSWAKLIIKNMNVDDLDDGIDEDKGYLSLTHGKEPEVINFKTADKEYNHIYLYINELVKAGINPSVICIVGRTNKQLDSIRKYFATQNCKLYEIKQSKNDDRFIEGVRISTMHRVKGLEFEYVVIADVNDEIIPLEAVIKAANDTVMEKDMYDAERALMYVAATRAKKELLVTSCGKPSMFISE
ncbi:3'-5' exonuclease [Clostridium sp.]|uniref:3'-5' exonuclease n=1 Tax=Clostridium sp. TaxID=1506 RepID=UPI003D6D3B45